MSLFVIIVLCVYFLYVNLCKWLQMCTYADMYLYIPNICMIIHALYIYMFCLQLLVRRCIVFIWHLHILCHYLHVHIICIQSHMSQHKSYPTHAPRRWPVESFGKIGQYFSLIFVGWGVGWAKWLSTFMFTCTLSWCYVNKTFSCTC